MTTPRWNLALLPTPRTIDAPFTVPFRITQIRDAAKKKRFILLRSSGGAHGEHAYQMIYLLLSFQPFVPIGRERVVQGRTRGAGEV